MPGKRRSALRDKQPGQIVIAAYQKFADGTEFVTGYWMLDGQRSFQPLDPKPRLLQIDMLTPQTYRLADPQTVAIHHQHQQVVAHAMTSTARGSEQPLDLTLVKEILDPLMSIGRGRFPPTLNITPLGCHLGPHVTLQPV